MISLLPDDTVIKLKELFDGKIETLTQDELTVLVTCYSESEINNTQLQYVVPQHRSDITKMLKKLCNEGFLISAGMVGERNTILMNPRDRLTARRIT